jgi:hypothetical protein
VTQSQIVLDEIVNLDDYPIEQKNNPARLALIDRCQTGLKENLCCSIPLFIRPNALQSMAAEALSLRSQAYDNNSRRNCYLQKQGDASLPDSHSRNHLEDTSTRMLAYDQIPESSSLKAFYHADAVRQMIADIVGCDELFDSEDPYQPANYVCYEHGDQSSWHFDSDNSFTVTLMIQAADEGGEFQMSPGARTDTDQNYNHVAEVLQGKRDDTVVTIAREAGALCVFRGCNALHRVTPVVGNSMRIMGVFVYERAAGVFGDQEVNETIYGDRVANS